MIGEQKLPLVDTASGKFSRSQRLTQIDGLRAIAALSVVAFHYTTRFDQVFHHVAPTGFELSLGYLGVNLFFAISGFVIYMTLDGIRAPLDFVISRFSRLFPAYWIAVALTWSIVSIVGLPGYGVTWKAAVINLTMLQSFFSVRDVDSVYWSLQVELLFYAWMLVLWVSGLLRHSAAICVGWVAIAGAATFVEIFLGIKVSFALKHFLLLEWMPWFVLGMIAYVTLRERTFGLKHGLAVLVAIATIAARNHTPSTILAVAVFGIVWAASRRKLRLLEWKPLVFFGMISYPLYLVHEQIGWIVIAKIETQLAAPWFAILAALFFVTVLATLLHNFVEMPGSRNIRKIYKKSIYAASTLNFNRARWALGALISILVLAAAFVISARI